MKIGLVQMSAKGGRARTRARALEYAARAADEGADLIAFNEFFALPYFPRRKGQDLSRKAEDPVKGPTIKALRRFAGERSVVLVAPFLERAAGRVYSSAAVIDSDGKVLGIHRKVHIPFAENFYERLYLEGGSDYPIFRTAVGRIGVLLSYDRHYPEAARTLGVRGADIVVIPACCSFDFEATWELTSRAHAVANGYFVATVNRCGKEGRIEFFGRSFLADPKGKVVGEMGAEEGAAVMDADISMVGETRRAWQFFRDRRPETYEEAGRMAAVYL